MSAGGPYDLNLIQGGTYRRTFRFLEEGVARPLAGLSVASQVRKKESPSAALILDLEPYMTLAGDTLTLVLPGPVTAALRINDFASEAAWDLWLIEDGDPGEGPMLAGTATLDPSPTRFVP